MLRAPLYSQAYNRAASTTEPYRGTDHTVAKMIQLVKGDQGERSVKVRRHAEQIVRHIRPKDYTSEVIALCRWWTNAIRYTRDPVHVEMLRSPERLVDDALQGRLAADCDEAATAIGASCLVIGAPIEFVTVGFRPRKGPKVHTHVFVQAQDPRTKQWWVLDPVAGRRTDKMLRRVKQFTRFAV
jgi:hypothetical protein